MSTVGSVLGTLILGFFPLPAVGSRIIVYSISVVLLVFAFVLGLYEARRFGVFKPISISAVSICIAVIAVIAASRTGAKESHAEFRVVTDDFNPLDSLQVRKAERYREHLVKRVGSEMLLW